MDIDRRWCLDTITNGYKNSDSNGYRKRFLDLLRKAGNQVDTVGSRVSRSISDSHDGHDGATTSEIVLYTNIYAHNPYVNLLHARLNDLNRPFELDTAPKDLDALVRKHLHALLDATILVARLVLNTNRATSGRVPVYK